MASLSRLTLVSGFLSISGVKISYDGTLGTKITTRTLDFTGTWEIGDYAILTSVAYDGISKELTIIGQSEGGKDLSINNVMESLAGTTIPLSSAISSFTFTGISGKIAGGTTVVVLNGKVGSGKISAVFQKSSSASAGAVVVDIGNFKLPELVQSATGADISSIPFFGSLVIHVKSIDIAPVFGDILRIRLKSFANGVMAFKVPPSVDLSVQALASQIPGIKDAVQALPEQIRSILSANVESFAFNSTSKDLTIMASLSRLTLVSGFLSISGVKISYDGTLGTKITTRTLDFTGTWEIGDYAILTSVAYDGISKELTITGQSEGGKDLSINNVMESLAGTTIPLSSAISSFTFTGISGKIAGGTTVVVLNGKVGSGKISAVFQKSSLQARTIGHGS